MPDIVINPSLGKIDFFTVKGEQVTNSMRLGDASTILFTGALSASSITTGGGGAFVTSVQPTANYLSKFTGNSTIANSLVYDNGTNVGIGTTVPSASLHINSTTAGATLLRTDGTNGTLFSVVDDLSDSLMSVNNSAGLPVLEVFTDDRIVAGQYGQNDFVVINNKVGIGTNNPLAKLHVTGSSSVPAAVFIGNVGIGTTSPASKLSIVGSAAATNFKSLILRNDDGTVGSAVSIDFETSAGTIGDEAAMAARISGIRLGGGTTGGLVFATTDNGNLGERVRILNNGAVGIGTTSPSLISGYVGLNVVNAGYTQIKLQSNASSAGIEFKPSSGNSWELQANNSNQWFVFDRTQDVYRLIIDVNGNVGIGATPIAPLDVQCNTGGTGIILRGRADNSTALRFYANNGTTQQLYIGTDDSNIDFNSVSTRPIRFFVNDLLQYQISQLGVFSWKDGAGGDRMRLNSTGLGIGTTSPNAKLDVNGNTIVTGSLTVTSTIVARNYIMATDTLYIQKGVGGYQSYITAEQTAASTGNSFKFWNSGTATLMTIGYDGNVGIGTTSPQYLLDLGTAGSANQLRARRIYVSGTGTGSGFTLDSTLIYQEAAGTFNITNPGSYPNVAFTINNSGNVGIGQTSPASKLHVVGSSFITGSANTSNVKFEGGGGNGLAFGTIDATSTYASWIQSGYVSNFGTATYNLLLQPLGGNVGINTTSPSTPLAVQSNAKQLRLQTTSGPTVYFTDIGARYDSSHPFTIEVANGAETATEYFGIYADGGGANNRIALLNGSVGIGTTAPAAKLHVSGSGQTVIRVEASTTTNVAVFAAKADTDAALIMGMYGGSGVGNQFGVSAARQAFIGTTSYSTVHPTSLVIGNVSNIPIAFGTDNTERMRITSDGNVGIGTTSPAFKLHVANGDITIANGNQTSGDFSQAQSLHFLNETTTPLATIKAVRTNWAQGQTDLTFSTYNSGMGERMRIDSGGNVGIGTTTPFGTTANRTVLSVNGTTDVSLNIGSGGSQRAYLYGVSSYAELGTIGSLPLRFAPNNSEKMRLDVNGNLGIGTTSVSHKLEVYNTADSPTYVRINNQNSGASAYTGVDLQSYGGGWQVRVPASTTFVNPLVFSFNATEKARITSDGNVGIGTTVPSASLHINSTTSGATLLRTDGTNGTLFSVVDDLSDSLMSVNNSAGLPVLEVFADDRIVGGQYGQNDLVVVNNKVGIGTNNPLAKLHVTGSASTPAAVFLGDVGIGTTAPTAQSNYRFLQVNGPTSAIIETTVGGTRIGGFDSTSNTLYVGSIGSFPVVFRTAVDEKMRISANGNVGIGTSSPAVKLDVVGDIRTSTGILFGTDTAAANLLDDYEEGTWTGTITGGTFTNLATGRYTKIGRQVFACINPNTTAITGNLIISGLPFTAGSRSAMIGTGLPPSGVTYIPRFVDGATIDITVAGTYAGGSVSTYFACIYEV